MQLSDTAKAFSDALFDTDGEHARRVIEVAISEGLAPEDIVFSVVLPSMEQLMARAECADGSTSLAQHFLASQISADVVERMIPRFSRAPAVAGRVVIGSASTPSARTSPRPSRCPCCCWAWRSGSPCCSGRRPPSGRRSSTSATSSS